MPLLANGQAEQGHHVGLIADSLTGGERAEAALAEIAPRLKLGVHRMAIHREPWPTDLLVFGKRAGEFAAKFAKTTGVAPHRRTRFADLRSAGACARKRDRASRFVACVEPVLSEEIRVG